MNQDQKLRHAILSDYCKQLRLPTVLKSYEALSRQARDQSLAYEDFLEQLLEQELNKRTANVIQQRIKDARFSDLKSLEQIEWNYLKGISKQKIQELESAEFINKKEDIVLAGPIGTGKTHVAIAIGLEACKRRYRVLFYRAADLVRELIEAKDDRQLGRMQNRLNSVDLLIIDELGFVPFERLGGELLFNLLANRYEKRSTLVTTNLTFSEWVKVFVDEKLTTALLDRLSHHAHILTTRGESYRSKNARKLKAEQEVKLEHAS